MALYNEAKEAKKLLSQLINQCVLENETVKSCIKARRAVVTTAANTTVANRVGVKLIGDNTELFLPYNPVFAPDELVKGMIVSVWYNYSLNNGIVMQDAKWQQGGNASGGQEFDPAGTYPELTSGKATADAAGNTITSFYAHGINFTIDNDTFILSAALTDANGNQIGQAKTIDLPLESVVVDGEFNEADDTIILTLQNGNTIDIPVGDLINGLASQTEVDNIVNGSTTVGKAANVTSQINGHAISDIFESDGTTVKNATNAEVANKTGSIVIQPNADLNDCTANLDEVQVYTCHTNSTAATLANCPVAVTFTLWATRAFHANDTDTRDFQFLIATNSQCYYRARGGGTNWANWRTLVESNGSYPTLGAGHLAKNLQFGVGTAGGAWYKVAEVDVSSVWANNANRSYSAFILLNTAHSPQASGTSLGSGLIEFDIRKITKNGVAQINATETGTILLAGNIQADRIATSISGFTVSLYIYLAYNYEALDITVVTESNEGVRCNYITLAQSNAGTSAPSGAVYAVNRNRARPTFIATKTAKVTNTPTIGRDIILNGADFVPENVTKGDNCVVYAYSEDTSWLCTGYVSITPPNPAIVITGVEEINNATPYLDKSTYQNDITGNKVFSSIGLSQNGRFRTWDGGSSNDSFPNNGGYEIASNGIWYYPGASISESYQIHWVDGANGKRKLAIDTDGLTADDNSNAVATTEWVTDKINDELSGIGATVDLTSDVTGILPVENGGTGASSLDAANIVTKNTTQVIRGGKSFSTIPQISAVINTSDNSTHVPTTAWVRTLLNTLEFQAWMLKNRTSIGNSGTTNITSFSSYDLIVINWYPLSTEFYVTEVLVCSDIQTHPGSASSHRVMTTQDKYFNYWFNSSTSFQWQSSDAAFIEIYGIRFAHS